ncbi:MAG: TRAP transporter small permease subunit [Candidatus Accumulibacter sp.]|nr:TRAP transporter small permease subunit [Accumulibacter sp.]MCB1964564.1 TRAP transporter small permease subunit [Accumulibacter sp.]
MTSPAHSADAPHEAGRSGIALPTTAFSRATDRLIGWFGEIASALWTVLVLVIVAQVVARYVFNEGSIMMEELQWHLYAIGFMLGLSFTEVHERNVRIDVLAESFGLRTRLWIELLGTSLLLLTFSGFVVWFSVPFFMSSWELSEISAAPGGLPYRWFLKSFLVTAFVLLALSGLGRLTRVWAALFGRR